MRRSAIGIAILALAVGLSPLTGTYSARASSPGRAVVLDGPVQSETVVLVALDGVRYQDVFNGVDARLAVEQGFSEREVLTAEELVPNLHRLARRDGAAVGAPDHGPAMIASGPNFVSLPGYVEMLTGVLDSGCRDNECTSVRFSTVAEDVVRESQDPWDAAVVASWSGIEPAAASRPGSVAVSVGRTAGITRAAFERTPKMRALLASAEGESPAPGQGDFRRDAHTARIAIEYLRAHRPRFLFVGLGETDEYAHAGDYRSYLRALSEADRSIGQLWSAARDLIRAGRPTTLFVTTDHGRAAGFRDHGARFPESARVWLIAAGSSIAARGLLASPRPRRLADVANTARSVLGLPYPRADAFGEPLWELFHERGASPIPELAAQGGA